MKHLCPFLPEIDHLWRASEVLPLRRAGDARYYLGTLCYAQSLLTEGKPAQALLQLTKSLSVEQPKRDILAEWAPAYQAKRWIFENRGQGELFLGNPVRHYQHLASRMSGPRSELRSWRAWACFHLAERVLRDCPRDEEQIAQEGLEIPSLDLALEFIEAHGWPEERETYLAAFGSVRAD